MSKVVITLTGRQVVEAVSAIGEDYLGITGSGLTARRAAEYAIALQGGEELDIVIGANGFYRLVILGKEGRSPQHFVRAYKLGGELDEELTERLNTGILINMGIAGYRPGDFHEFYSQE